MRRLLIMAMLAMTATVWAQSPDSTRAAARELGGDERPARSRERNVLGAPVYYDTLGNIRGASAPADGQSRLPKHHYFNRLSNDFCSYFVELEGMVGPGDAAIGFNFSYLPQRWGLYGSALVGVRRDYFSIGPALRLSDNGDYLDWHLYGGLVISRHLGAEIGIRMASSRRSGDFCWQSVSMGAAFVNGRGFVTAGLSLELSAIATAAFLWW